MHLFKLSLKVTTFSADYWLVATYLTHWEGENPEKVLEYNLHRINW